MTQHENSNHFSFPHEKSKIKIEFMAVLCLYISSAKESNEDGEEEEKKNVVYEFSFDSQQIKTQRIENNFRCQCSQTDIIAH